MRLGLLQKIYLIIKYSKLMGFMYKHTFFLRKGNMNQKNPFSLVLQRN